MKLCNGGKIQFDKKQYIFKNTCSIDYYLLVIFFVVKNNCETVKKRATTNDCGQFYSTGLQIKQHLANNNWNMARLIWAKFFGNKMFVNDDGCIVYDFFLHVEESFFNKKTKIFQEFEFYYKCNDKCFVNNSKEKEVSSKFLLM